MIAIPRRWRLVGDVWRSKMTAAERDSFRRDAELNHQLSVVLREIPRELIRHPGRKR